MNVGAQNKSLDDWRERNIFLTIKMSSYNYHTQVLLGASALTPYEQILCLKIVPHSKMHFNAVI